MDGWVGVEGPDEDFDLRVDAFLFFGGFAEDGEGADAFAVEALFWGLVEVGLWLGGTAANHVLSKALRDAEIVTFRLEMS